ncbi:hypothetical protein FB45DRAFT_1055746 [Roridomyces roridus]|uniref:Flavin-containing monooxygenase n=1 Tax=Roridomyces roridus TaxID=1738132 RepID=A0AAD7C0U8_9AGAR|nr:hypothetical protein FB45DRAFT_1055746 [Roridomyces roridus]
MSAEGHIKEFPIPTFPSLGVSGIPADLDVTKVAAEWFDSFTSVFQRGDVEGVASLFIPVSHWRDMLALTWDFRSFHGIDLIRQFLTDRLVGTQVSGFKINHEFTQLQRPYDDIAWIKIHFDFETDVGLASGIVRIVPQPNNAPWKAHVMFTNLENFKDFPEQCGTLRNEAPNHGLWSSQRAQSLKFENEEPTVLIIGAGHSGLDLAARLKVLNVRTVCIDRNPRVGDNWRNRYDALCLHDPVWYDHMPFIPFPATWPVYTPARKLANWLEHYAEAMELDVWTSSTVKSARKNAAGTWDVVVERDGVERVFNPHHVVFATGIGANEGRTPVMPGMEDFKGQILHSTKHKTALDHAGKKVVIIGACTSAHDIAIDYYRHGVDITMFQRSSTHVFTVKKGWKHMVGDTYWEGGPPTDVADRITASYPHYMAIELSRRRAKLIAEDDKELLDGLHSVGFRTNSGLLEAGSSLLPWNRAGGYYIDVGASQMIIDGKIKLKNDSQIKNFDATGICFENGSHLDADVVVFATGLSECRDAIKYLCGEEIGSKCKKIWGLDQEGEIYGAWRDIGVDGLWYMTGNYAYSRFHSKHVALQIKAMEEGIFGTRYQSAETI